jgi:hypothetical protein
MRTLRASVLAVLGLVAVSSLSGCYAGFYGPRPVYAHRYHHHWYRW